MATTTMGNSNKRTTPNGVPARSVNPTVLWVIGAAVLLALVIFYAMSTRNADVAAPMATPSATSDSMTDTTTGRALPPTTNTDAVNANGGVSTGPVERNGAYDQNAVGTGTTTDTNRALTPGTATENAPAQEPVRQ